jgi:RNA polymerase sigma-70 factor (ECF subfamily)
MAEGANSGGHVTSEGQPLAAREFEQQVEEHRGRLLKVAYLMLGNREDAEDATQRAILKALTARHRFRGESGLYTWLYRILLNHCKDRFKARSRAQKTFVPMPVDAEVLIASKGPSAQERMEQRETVELVRRAVAKLPAPLREILILRHFEEMPYEEIAETLECPVGTVRSRLSKAREKFRTTMERERRAMERGWTQ